MFVTKSKRVRGGLEYHVCSPLRNSAPWPPVAVILYVILYWLALAAPRTSMKLGPVAAGDPEADAAAAVLGAVLAAMVALALALVVVGVEPPHATTAAKNKVRTARFPSIDRTL